MSSLQRSIAASKGMPPPSGGGGGGAVARKQRDYSPLPWSNYYDRKENVTFDNGNVFRVYYKGSEGPLLLLLHGGGHSALSWACLSVHVSSLCNCRVMAIDLRWHGKSKTVDKEGDLSGDTMADDVEAVLLRVFGMDPPPIVLVGHSMGGALAVRIAARKSIRTLIGLVVIDVVEGTAMDALASMQNFLRGRPKSFRSVEHAIEWGHRGGQIRNLESARVSMPAQVRRANHGAVPTAWRAGSAKRGRGDVAAGSLVEEDENTDSDGGERTAAEDLGFVWRTDLEKTAPFWRGWFQGLSKSFLSVPAAKLLLLAGVDRLDKDLTIAQMQGKFQMHVLPEVGHAIHEDAPDKVAEVLADFLVRNKFTARRPKDEK